MTELKPQPEAVVLLTASEVAVRLRVHKATVHTLLKEGALKGFKLGRRWRITEASLLAFIEERNQSAKEKRECLHNIAPL